MDPGHTPGSEGWYGPPASRRYHYFGTEGRSLCGKWFVFAWSAELIDKALGPADGDCAACKRKLSARAAVAGEAQR